MFGYILKDKVSTLVFEYTLIALDAVVLNFTE